MPTRVPKYLLPTRPLTSFQVRSTLLTLHADLAALLAARFFQNSASASRQTRLGPVPASLAWIDCPRRCERSAMADGSVRSEGRRSVENASDASRGRSVGRWSIETTVSDGPDVTLVRERPSACDRMTSQTLNSAPGNVNGRLVERRVDRVDRDGVVGVRRVARDVNDDAERTLVPNGRDGLGRDERGDLGGEVDAVDEDVNWSRGASGRKSALRSRAGPATAERGTHPRGSPGKDHPWRSLPCPI